MSKSYASVTFLTVAPEAGAVPVEATKRSGCEYDRTGLPASVPTSAMRVPSAAGDGWFNDPVIDATGRTSPPVRATLNSWLLSTW